MFLIFFACHSPENLDNYQKINNVKDSNKTCCENSRVKYLNEGIEYISKNRLSLNSTKNIQLDNEMKMAYIPEGTFLWGQAILFRH